MAADPSFGDRVLVTSSATRVDTGVLVSAALGLRLAAGEVPGVLAMLDAAADRCRSHLGLAPVEAIAALTVLDGARAGALELGERLESLAESLSFAALVYLGAEGRAAAFHDAWVLLTPGADHSWATGPGSVHSRGVVRGVFPGLLDAHVPDQLLDWTLAPTLPFLLGGGLAAFAQVRGMGDNGAGTGAAGGGGDPTGGMRLQLDLRAASELLADHTLTTRPTPGGGVGGSGPVVPSWWGTPDGATAEAASLAASWGLGLGRIGAASTRGVQVTSAVPVDTLDVRTGQPVGVRARHDVVGSDAAARRFGLNLTPLNLGIVGLPSLVGSTLGAVPVRQGGPAVAVAPAGAPPHRVPTPRMPSQVLARVSGLRSARDAGQVEILRHSTPGAGGAERRSWSVVIRGTQVWGVGGANPQDMLSNLQAVAGEESDQSRAVLAAMERAGIAAGEPVELVGHSQGGAIAAQLASDPEVSARYRVASVLTAGAPTGGAETGPEVGMLNLENTRDPVPGLDGAANRDLGASRTVHFDGGLLGARADEGGVAGPHDLATYRTALEWLETETGASAGAGGPGAAGNGSGSGRAGTGGLGEVRQWVSDREEALGLGADTRTTAFTFDSRRLPARP